jgi:hypothetical protein
MLADSSRYSDGCLEDMIDGTASHCVLFSRQTLAN